MPSTYGHVVKITEEVYRYHGHEEKQVLGSEEAVMPSRTHSSIKTIVLVLMAFLCPPFRNSRTVSLSQWCRGQIGVKQELGKLSLGSCLKTRNGKSQSGTVSDNPPEQSASYVPP